MSIIQASLQELRERRFASEVEKLKNREAQLLSRRVLVNQELREVRRQLDALASQEGSDHGSTGL